MAAVVTAFGRIEAASGGEILGPRGSSRSTIVSTDRSCAGMFIPSLVFTLALAALPVARPAAAASQEVTEAEALRRAEAEHAWSFQLPTNFTTRIRSYSLADNYLVAVGSDGRAWCVRADTGEFLWATRVAEPGETVWPPQAYHSSKNSGIVFVTLNEASLVDFTSGLELRHVRLRTPSAAPPAFSENRAYIPSSDGRLFNYDISGDHIEWQVGTRGPLLIGPLYLPEDHLLVLADYGGELLGIDGVTRAKRFARQLPGEPKGWLTGDEKAIYVATSGDEPMLHALSREKAETLWAYRLAGRPEGGPVVTKSGVYQGVLGGGVHRVGLTREFPNWYVPGARQFLAEWPGRVVLLLHDGSIGFVDMTTGQPLPPLRLEPFSEGVRNAHNDMVIVATPKATLRAIRPAGAPPLSPKDFVPATQPAAAPAGPATPGQPTGAEATQPAPGTPQ